MHSIRILTVLCLLVPLAIQAAQLPMSAQQLIARQQAQTQDAVLAEVPTDDKTVKVAGEDKNSTVSEIKVDSNSTTTTTTSTTKPEISSTSATNVTAAPPSSTTTTTELITDANTTTTVAPTTSRTGLAGNLTKNVPSTSATFLLIVILCLIILLISALIYYVYFYKTTSPDEGAPDMTILVPSESQMGSSVSNMDGAKTVRSEVQVGESAAERKASKIAVSGSKIDTTAGAKSTASKQG